MNARVILGRFEETEQFRHSGSTFHGEESLGGISRPLDAPQGTVGAARSPQHGIGMRDATASARPEVGANPFADAPITVVMIEGDGSSREELCAALRREPGIAVGGCGGDAAVVALFSQLTRPAVLLIDATRRDDRDLRICAQVRVRFPEVRVVLMGMTRPHDELVAYLHVGVAGFIMQDAPLSQIVVTIRHVAAGDAALPRAMTNVLFAHFADQVPATPANVLQDGVLLTAREREVMALLGEGLNNRDIALRLHIAIHTVKSHVHNILEKLSLHSRLEVAAYSRTPGRRQ